MTKQQNVLFCDECGKEVTIMPLEFTRKQVEDAGGIMTDAGRCFCSKVCLHKWISNHWDLVKLRL